MTIFQPSVCERRRTIPVCGRHRWKNGLRRAGSAMKKALNQTARQPPPRGVQSSAGQRPLRGAAQSLPLYFKSHMGSGWRFLAGQFLTLTRHSDCRSPACLADNRLRVTSHSYAVGPPRICLVPGATAPNSAHQSSRSSSRFPDPRQLFRDNFSGARVLFNRTRCRDSVESTGRTAAQTAEGPRSRRRFWRSFAAGILRSSHRSGHP